MGGRDLLVPFPIHPFHPFSEHHRFSTTTCNYFLFSFKNLTFFYFFSLCPPFKFCIFLHFL